MPASPRHTLICTVGTSLYNNLDRIPDDDDAYTALRQAYADQNWPDVVTQLRSFAPTERMCGAEINSVADLLAHLDVKKGQLHLLRSDTGDGEAVVNVLTEYFKADGWCVNAYQIAGLRDDDPKAFRTWGLRNLAKAIGERVRESGAEYCAINATGGYKAQIAIAVLMGQALDIPVYYKHERFDAIIPFPPMPVALDFSLWERASGMFTALSRPNACEPSERFLEDWDERYEPLINREDVDGTPCLELSATGQIFHETFRTRFQRSKAVRLPRDAKDSERQHPNIAHHSYGRARKSIQRYLQRLTDERPYIRLCHSTYWNPDLPESTRFRCSGGEIEGIYSNGSWCVKFRVLTTTDDQDLLGIVVADLNDWLES